MSIAPMTLDEFETLLDIHGAQTQRWPTAARARGTALLDASAAARALHRQALALAADLDLVAVVNPPNTAALRARILDDVKRSAATRGIMAWLGDGWLRPAVMALIPLCVGIAIGIGFPESSTVSDELVSDASLFAFAAYEEYPDAQ